MRSRGRSGPRHVAGHLPGYAPGGPPTARRCHRCRLRYALGQRSPSPPRPASRGPVVPAPGQARPPPHPFVGSPCPPVSPGVRSGTHPVQHLRGHRAPVAGGGCRSAPPQRSRPAGVLCAPICCCHRHSPPPSRAARTGNHNRNDGAPNQTASSLSHASRARRGRAAGPLLALDSRESADNSGLGAQKQKQRQERRRCRAERKQVAQIPTLARIVKPMCEGTSPASGKLGNDGPKPTSTRRKHP